MFRSIAFLICLSPAVSLAFDKDSVFIPYLSYTNMKVVDPERDSGTNSEVSHFGLGYMVRRSRAVWLYSKIFYVDSSFSGSQTSVGQSVDGYGVNLSMYYKFITSKSFRPLLGVGASFNDLSFKDRFTVATDGFLEEQLPDRSSQYASVTASAMHTIDFFSMKFLLDVGYEYSDKGVDGIFISIGYRI